MSCSLSPVPRVTKAQGPPSRGPSAFIFYATEYRKAHPGTTVVDNARAAGVAWRALSDAEKQVTRVPVFAPALSLTAPPSRIGCSPVR